MRRSKAARLTLCVRLLDKEKSIMEEINNSDKKEKHKVAIAVLAILLLLAKVLWAISIWYEVIPLGLALLLIWRLNKSEKQEYEGEAS